MGAIMRHGPHHVAQKSTTARPSCFSISCSKSASVTATAFDISVSLQRLGFARPGIGLTSRASPTFSRCGSAMSIPPSRRGTRLAHIGIAVRSLDEILPFYRDILDLPEVPLDDADGASIAGLAAGDPLVELLEAESPDSPIGRFVAKRGPGIHHLCFSVDDIDAALERCRAAGIRLIDESPRIGAEKKRIAFLHPSSTSGVLVELSEH